MNLLTTPPLWFAALLAALFALGAYGARLLTLTGAISTFVVGFLIYGLGDAGAAIPLLAFFLSSSLLSKLFRAKKAATEQTEAKGSTRDAGQVWANGGVPVLMVVVFALLGKYIPVYRLQFFPILFLAALAAMNADTWATEIGKLSRSKPRLLSNFRPAEPRTSGAVSLLGLLAALLGAAFIPLSALLLWRRHLDFLPFLIVVWAGFLGSLLDSILGASVQAVYRHPETGQLTERTEIGGIAMEHLRGIPVDQQRCGEFPRRSGWRDLCMDSAALRRVSVSVIWQPKMRASGMNWVQERTRLKNGRPTDVQLVSRQSRFKVCC